VAKIDQTTSRDRAMSAEACAGGLHFGSPRTSVSEGIVERDPRLFLGRAEGNDQRTPT
jgi:hypothetical protein